MSDEENDDPRDNTSPEPKPEYTAKKNAAPAGHLGVRHSNVAPTPGGSVKILNINMQVAVQEDEQTPIEPELDDRPVAIETGDEAVDRQSEQDGYRLKSLDEIQEETRSSSVETESKPITEDLTAAKTNDPELNEALEKQGYNLTTDHAASDTDADLPYDRPRGSYADLKESFNRVQERAKSHQKSQQNEIE